MSAEQNFLENTKKNLNCPLFEALLQELGLEYSIFNRGCHFQVRDGETLINIWPSSLRVDQVINDHTHFSFDARRMAIVNYFKEITKKCT